MPAPPIPAAPPVPLVQKLPDGPVDIVGDIHGELDALLRLLERLGCDPEAPSVERPLVFVGDLVDRGPDSPGVVRIVKRLVDAGLAWCVAGNHELNLLCAEEKEGNGWFLGHRDHYRGRDFESVPVAAEEADELRAFLASLPIALEREDLRVVHAAYDARSIAKLPAKGDLAALTCEAAGAVTQHLRDKGIAAAARAERRRFSNLRDPEDRPDRWLPATLAVTVAEQSLNPYKVLTSGKEEPIPEDRPLFYVGGKWRVVERARWWRSYEEEPAVVIGHYWRRRGERVHGKRDLFDDIPTYGWAGPRGNVFCVDYSVGRRFLERWQDPAAGVDKPFRGALAALRWPERTLVFDDHDEVVQTTGFGA